MRNAHTTIHSFRPDWLTYLADVFFFLAAFLIIYLHSIRMRDVIRSDVQFVTEREREMELDRSLALATEPTK